MSAYHTTLATAAVLLLGLSTATQATAATPRIEVRENIQEHRIAHGVHSGELTRGEAAVLRHGQHVVDIKQRIAAADGVVTVAERAVITREQNQQSRRIARHKHDAQHRRR